MSVGIVSVGSYIPKVEDCRTKLDRHDVEESFIIKKTGFVGNSKMEDGEKASDMCVKAFQSLEEKCGTLKDKVDFLIVCTQNGDYLLPQTSALVHSKLDLPQRCAALDISLGCSGYVYALNVAKSFMESNGLQCGIVLTADPYSGIIDIQDKNTDLLFGDAATATLLAENAAYELGKAVFDTKGADYDALLCEHGGQLYMDGRRIFDFVLRHVPKSISNCLELNGIGTDDVEYFLLHQASRYLVENMARRLRVDVSKVPFVAAEYGNTVSSSVPLALENYFDVKPGATMVLSGFGVGLSMATTTIQRI